MLVSRIVVGAIAEMFVDTSNLNPVDFANCIARNSPSCRNCGSARIFVDAGKTVAVEEAEGQSVNVPDCICTNCGSGMSAGADSELVLFAK